MNSLFALLHGKAIDHRPKSMLSIKLAFALVCVVFLNMPAWSQVVALFSAPKITLGFNPANVAPGGKTTLMATIANPNSDPVQLNSQITITGLPGGVTLSGTSSIACSDGSGASDPPIVIPANNGTCTLTFANVSAGTTAGGYTATWGPGVQFVDNNNQNIVVNTTTAATAQLTVGVPDFSLAAQATSLSIAQGASATDTIAIAATNGFTGNVSLAASGLPSGVTASFAPNGSASSTLTLTASAAAAVGNSTVTITGTSGSLRHATTVHLAIVSSASSFAISPAITGSWYNPAQSGHGFNIEVLSGNQLIAYWYVFDTNGNMLWLSGLGSYSGNSAVLDLISVTGGDFPPNFDPANIARTSWGTLNLSFTDCNNGTAAWTPSVPSYTAGSLAITRLTSIPGLTCQ